MKKPAWKSLDEALLEKLRPFEKQEYRTLENFEKDRILPEDTLYFKRKVSAMDGRLKWHTQAISALSQADLIFLDQDNGFEIEPRSMMGKTHKYALYSEAVDYFNRGKIVIGIQFAAKVKPSDRVEEVRKRFAQFKCCATDIAALRGRVTPNILFFTISPPECVEKVRGALAAFEAESPVVNDFKRIELMD